LQLKMLDDLFTYNRPTLVDFGGGDAEYKRLFSNDATTGATVWMLRPGLRTCLLRAMLAVQSRAAKAARRMLECAGLFRQLRQRYRFKVQSAVARPAEDAEVNDA
jgi:CelD/BcsL family acetyltransferase involved in cellulose biosynthesis